MTTARRFVLLDRDGTINVEHSYISDPDLIELYPGAGAALRRLRQMGFGLVVVTNQSAIGRGYFDLSAVERVNQRFRALLAADDVTVDGIYICPHAPEEDCACRKPQPGLVEQAVAEHGFDPREAFMIGDKSGDIGLARAVGAVAILVRTGHGARTEAERSCNPDVVVDDLPAAVAWIERTLTLPQRAGRP
jgi:D-glycero-D-manno-heptose 1,7-bisphosphate phosphatase